MIQVVPFEAQLGQQYGGTLCTAVATARAIDWATLGKTRTTGAHIRSLTDEPVPDPKSPGLNLAQVAAAAARMGVHLDARVGPRAVAWAEYEARREAGQGCIIQLSYKPIGRTVLDAAPGFTGGHAMFEDVISTLDSMADGRRNDVWEYDARLYPRDLILQAGASLDLGNGTTPLPGRVWAAFTLDVIPDWVVAVKPAPHTKTRSFASYTVHNGVITHRVLDHSGGFSARCTPPQLVRDPKTRKYRYLVEVTQKTSSRDGAWLSAGRAREV